ncbi:hypothetical protein OESDEN_09154 [Oesophagostomum dentatum]|uniref:Uncharacterized protein n=1 Tax=Oesophagostomum dentatum TaxID=61180 RepID=A0A0B1T162_OESDE|nr:hypothetical protein OESDEN_09154 [Oesophagostomum dentatum]
MVSDVGNGFKIVCLFEAKYNTLIRTINVFLVQLDRIQHSDDVMRETHEIEKTVESIAHQLLAFASSNTSRRSPGGGYTKNPERTAYFIEKTSLKCEITMEYFRRQAVNILLELCTESFRLTAPQKLAHFRKTVSRVINTSAGSIWSDMQLAIATESKSAQMDNFMSPLDLGFDMVAYSVTIPAKSISVTFTPGWVKNEFDTPLKWSSSNGSAELVGKSGKRFNLLKIRKQHKHSNASWSTVLRSLRTYVNRANSTEDADYAYAIALFEEGINNKLAEKELSKLIDVVSANIYSISPYLH